MLNYLRHFTPRPILQLYHKVLALAAALVYGFPSEKMIVVGVTGTNGKSTTVYLIVKVLEAGGFKVGATSTVLFKVAEREWLNDKKMTMLGRFQLQKLLRQMLGAGCQYVVIETSSQGIEQYRHLGINYDYAVFTNLTPEHLEAHGGWANYQRAKGKLFEHLTQRKRKILRLLVPTDGGARFAHPAVRDPALREERGERRGQDDTRRIISKVSVVNMDDERAEYFLQFAADKKIKFAVQNQQVDFGAQDIEMTKSGTQFSINGEKINLKLIGDFNVYNALPAIAIGMSAGLTLSQIKVGLENVPVVPGRMEFIDAGQPFDVLVDYAPEPAAMGKLYKTIKILNQVQNDDKRRRIIHVLGSCGGGRDKARRPVLGKMAGENADIVIVTNEDPYGDDPLAIVDAVAAGAVQAGKKENESLFKIIDRQQAIEKAIKLARPGDLVLVTGKGAEQAMAVAGGKYIPWDDRQIIRACLRSRVG